MKTKVSLIILAILSIAVVLPATGQAPLKNSIWARSAPSLTLDGVLDEFAWTKAESVIVRYGIDAGMPGSGWKPEAGRLPGDSTRATLKFLVVGNQLYLGARCRDKSIGGSELWERWEGLLMSIKDHTSTDAPKPPTEYFYSWWDPDTTAVVEPRAPGQGPNFFGKWGGTFPPIYNPVRTPEQISAWDARTVVHGLSNDDSANDTDYTVEMRFDLGVMGYDVTRPQGDVVEWNISIYDCDWFWPIDGTRFGANRVWWESAWGNAAWYDEVRIHAVPTVTIYDTTLPTIGPELRVPNGVNETTPTIDGSLSDAVWAKQAGFRIKYGDDALRLTYPGVGPHRAGQYQPTVNGGLAAILDPADATVKMFFKGDYLYLGFDVRDKVVQYHQSFDRWDGFIVTLNDRLLRGPDKNFLGERLSFQVGPTGQAMPQDSLIRFVNKGWAQVAINLRSGTTVDTLGQQADNGYTAELAIDLTKLSYPSGLGDGSLFVGVNHLDGDSFLPMTDSYGTRTWWFRQYENDCCPAWAYMDPALLVADAGETEPSRPSTRMKTDVSPNPFDDSARIEYLLPQSGRVTLRIFDIQGRMLEERLVGEEDAGLRTIPIDAAAWATGIYHYTIEARDSATGSVHSRAEGRMVHLR
jgi:hypothetical protein